MPNLASGESRRKSSLLRSLQINLDRIALGTTERIGP